MKKVCVILLFFVCLNHSFGQQNTLIKQVGDSLIQPNSTQQHENTPTINDGQWIDILNNRIALIQAEYNKEIKELRSECKTDYSNYLEHVSHVLVLIGILISATCIFVPYLINKRSIDKIKVIEEKIEKTNIEAKQYAANSYVASCLSQAAYEKDDSNKMSLYKLCLEIDPESFPVHYNLGLYYYDKKDYNSAISHFNKAIELNPDSVSSLIQRALCWEELKNYKNAINDNLLATKKDPHNTLAFYNLGCCHLENEEIQESINDFTNTINLKQDYYKAYTNRGTAYYRLGKYKESINDYLRAIENGETDKQLITLNLGNAYYEDHQSKEAIKYYQEYEKLKPEDYSFYHRLIIALQETGNIKDAIQYCLNLIAKTPNDIKTILMLGELYHMDKEFQKSIDCLSKVDAKDMGQKHALLARADCYVNLKQYKEAIADYSHVIDLDPYDYRTLRLRSFAYALDGQSELAEKDKHMATLLEHTFTPAYVITNPSGDMESDVYKAIGEIAKDMHDANEGLL